MRRFLILLAALLAAQPVALSARAEDKTPDAWQFTVTPYGWAMGVSGSTTAKGQTANINASPIDLFQKTDTLVALMANVEARRDKLRLDLDAVYTRMVLTPGIAAQRDPKPWLSLSASAGANVTSTMVILEGTAAYEVAKLGEQTALDAYAGVRYWHAQTDMSFAFNATGSIRSPEDTALFTRSFGIAGASSGSMDWADPLLGLQVRHEIAPHHNLRFRGDIGGFGAGSQFTWQTFAGYAYEFSSGPTSWSAVLGYRALGVTYTAGSGADYRGIDAVMHGPIIGLSTKF